MSDIECFGVGEVSALTVFRRRRVCEQQGTHSDCAKYSEIDFEIQPMHLALEVTSLSRERCVLILRKPRRENIVDIVS